MKKYLEDAKNELEQFYNNKKDATGKTYDLACDYLDWVMAKTRIISNEKEFKIPDNIQIKRGMVFWINFGFNIDQELGGRHPGIILRVGGRTSIVLPLSTQEPTPDQVESGLYVRIEKVYGFAEMPRWTNVLNTMPVSIQRFDFNSAIGNIKGWELDKINDAMMNTGLWKIKRST